MKKSKINILLVTVVSIVMTSCSDFLDKTPVDYDATQEFYQNETAIEYGVTGVYNLIHMTQGYMVPHNVSYEHFTAYALERTEDTTIGAGGLLLPNNTTFQEIWDKFYKLIARANAVIDGSQPYLEGLGATSQQYVAEARVLRAYCYYLLIGLYGDVPFVTVPVDPTEYTTTERTAKEDILDFILAEFEDCAQYLPWTATQRGRVDRAVAYGLKARAALLGGSLDYRGNANSYFRISADAAEKVIGQRGLAQNFRDLFYIAGQEKADVRNELLFELMYSRTASTQQLHVVGFGQASRQYAQTGRHPAMLVADTYECIDGLRIDESPLYNPKRPQDNRDPRFNHTLWMHGDTVYGYNITFILDVYNAKTKQLNEDGEWVEVDNFDINSSAAWASFANAGVGYIWKKFSDERDENISTQSSNIPVLRYAEVLLTYAEAKIELGELDNTVYDAINQVRNRAGMPDVSSDRIGNIDKMRQLVRRERKVELILEGQFLIDFRRWQIGDIINDSPSYGYPVMDHGGYEAMTEVPNFHKSARHDLNDVANYDAYSYKLHVRDKNRTWNDKYYLWPIPQLERDRNEALTQNPGY